MNNFASIDIYKINNYSDATKEMIKNNKEVYDDIETLIKDLKKDNGYHFRIIKNNTYIFFGDLDNYKNDINVFIELLQLFLKKNYNLYFEKEEFKYTQNNVKPSSYHYSIPKWTASTEKLKEIHMNFIKLHREELSYKTDKRTINNVDTTIYSNHWFRCPNQSKGDNTNGKHIIKNGIMKDFIVSYIPENSVNIENIEIIKEKTIVKKTLNDEIVEINKPELENKQLILSRTLGEPELYKKMFDECYTQERFENYDSWIQVGMAINNIFDNNEMAFKLFDYFSSKGGNYEGTEKTFVKFNTFIKKNNVIGYTVATIYYYAIEDNKPKFVEIMMKNTLELGQTDICKYIKILAGNRFLYQVTNNGTNYKLYCYNGKRWLNNDSLLKKFISEELYNLLKTMLTEVYWNTTNNRDFIIMKQQLDNLKKVRHKKDIIETYKEYGANEEVVFDDKWWLLGFNNMVYDLKEQRMRKYNYDDYISTTTGYNWKEPNEEEIETVNNLIEKIMPIKEERDLYLQVLATSLDGRCLEKFIIFNGGGGNGKGCINDLLLCALGDHAMIGNNNLLFEASKMGSNPEKANMHKKRLVIFREPPQKRKFENSTIKELTGGGTFSARSHYEKDTKKELNLTMIVECNKRPLFNEEPDNAEVRRIIDIYFRSTFTTNRELLDDEKYVFEANEYYKTKDFQEKHKFALLKILFNEHKKYLEQNSVLKLPKSIEERTKNYLELSCLIIEFFKQNYEFTKNKDDIMKPKDVHNKFTQSEMYLNLTKSEKLRYNKTYFTNYIGDNKFFAPFYHLRYGQIRNVIIGWKEKKEDDDEYNI